VYQAQDRQQSTMLDGAASFASGGLAVGGYADRVAVAARHRR
jgi:hypothetical protein